MGLANKDLRDCSATCDAHHVLAGIWQGVYSNFFNFSDTLGFQNLLGANAIRANSGGVHLHVGHKNSNQNSKKSKLFISPD
jgi:hypothetical protein